MLSNLNLQTMLPVINAHSPAGASSLQMIHFGQVIRSMLFRRFDHGIGGNLALYGQAFPPLYNLWRVTTPTHLYYGANDWMVTPVDTSLLATALPNLRLLYMVPHVLWNHMDFVWGMNVRTLVYRPMLNTMRLYS